MLVKKQAIIKMGTVIKTGIFASGIGTFVYLYHTKQYSNSLSAEAIQDVSCYGRRLVQGKAAVPRKIAQGGPLVLQLKQVQVIFRHGARTPLHLTPKLHEGNYHEMITREHQASLFPYERVLLTTGEPADWSDYEIKLTQVPLKSGVCAGALSAFGKDQMYLLGKTLQKNYRESLNMATYNPNEVFVLSSNIKRTVESARCVMAGFFGKEQLSAYAEFCSPVKIMVTPDDYNTLIPNTTSCQVLRKVNHTSMFLTDNINDFMAFRLKMENRIDAERQNNICRVENVQNKINRLEDCFPRDSCERKKVIEVNKLAQLYLYDPVMQSLYEERGEEMAKVDRIWADALVRNPYLSKVITDNDLRALNYLRKLEVQEFADKFYTGYRFNFFFDPNPFFYNEHLCKEVYIYGPPCTDLFNWTPECDCDPDNSLSAHTYIGVLPCAKPSYSTPVKWKKCGSLLLDPNAELSCDCQTKGKKKSNKCGACKKRRFCRGGEDSQQGAKTSFFHWYAEPTRADHDPLGMAIKDEVWPDPVKSLKGERKLPDDWSKEFNCVSARDDITSRWILGLEVPKVLLRSEEIIQSKATSMLHWAMNGQFSTERSTVNRLSAGPVWTQMIDSMESMIKGKENTPRLCLYSAHDSTMTAVLEALHLWRDEWPPFASDFRIELYKDVNSPEHYIRILYCGEVQKIRNQKVDFLHWCDFKDIVSKLMITEDVYWNICNSNVLEVLAKNRYSDVESSESPAGM